MANSENDSQVIEAYHWQEECTMLKNIYCITDYNKGNMFYTLSNKIKENAKDRNLRKLFTYAICDEGFLFDRYTLRNKQLIQLSCLETKKRLLKFSSLVEQEHRLHQSWIHIIEKKAFSISEHLFSDKYDDELNWLCELFREIFEISKEQSPELSHNLQYFILQTQQNDDLGAITPLYLFQVMIRHTNRLICNQNLQIVLPGLWKFKKYKIEKNNGKNFSQYEKYIRLFCKLCKYYKGNPRINIDLCRYGMEQCSNLPDWTTLWWQKKEKKTRSKLHMFVKNLSLSCIEFDAPKEYSIYAQYEYNETESIKLLRIDLDSNLWLTSIIKEYILAHIELLVQFMQHHYNDNEETVRIVLEIYHKSGYAKKAPGNLSIGTKLLYIYDQLVDMLDSAIEDAVWQAVQKISESYEYNFIPVKKALD